MLVIVGDPALVVIVLVFEPFPVPAEFVARTLKAYLVLVFRPVTVAEFVVGFVVNV